MHRVDTVSIRAPVRGATRTRSSVDTVIETFQSAPPCGGRPAPVDDCQRHWQQFQSAPPCGGRPTASRNTTTPARRFNPRPRAGGDLAGRRILLATEDVSIRAPVRGATHGQAPRRQQGAIVSIRAPVRGATHGQAPRRQQGAIVSIRAPVRGATAAQINNVITTVLFQSAPPCGGRLDARKSLAHTPNMFQSAPPCGGRRPYVHGRSRADSGFNPRPRAGGDCGSVSHDRVKINQSVYANLMKRRWSEDRVARTWLRSRVVALLGYATGCANLSGEA